MIDLNVFEEPAMATNRLSSWDVEVYFDGDCPLCRREIAYLRRADRRRRIRFTDIAAPGFSAAAVGLAGYGLMAEIHGRLPDGAVIRGVEVFRRLYSAVGWGPLVRLSRLPGIRLGLDVAYRVFARHRLRLTGRCHAACPTRTTP